MKKLKGQKSGVALLWSLVIITVLLVITGSMATVIIKESHMTVDITDSSQAYANAKSGTDWAQQYITDLNPAPSYPTASTPFHFDLKNGTDDIGFYEVTIQGTSYPYTISSKGYYAGATRKIETKFNTKDLGSPVSNTMPIAGIGNNSESFTMYFDFLANSSSGGGFNNINFGLSDSFGAGNINLFTDGSGTIFVKSGATTTPAKNSSGDLKMSDLADGNFYRATIHYIKNSNVLLKITDIANGSCKGSALTDENTGSFNRNYLYPNPNNSGTITYLANGDTTYNFPYFRSGGIIFTNVSVAPANSATTAPAGTLDVTTDPTNDARNSQHYASPGAPVTLTWSPILNSNEAYIDNGVGPISPADLSKTVTPASLPMTYTLTVIGSNGTRITSSVTISQTPINTLIYNVAANGGGTISGQPNQSLKYGDTGTQVSANPNAGYVFGGWTVGGSNYNSPTPTRTDKMMSSPLTFTANFYIGIGFENGNFAALPWGAPASSGISGYGGTVTPQVLTSGPGWGPHSGSYALRLYGSYYGTGGAKVPEAYPPAAGDAYVVLPVYVPSYHPTGTTGWKLRFYAAGSIGGINNGQHNNVTVETRDAAWGLMWRWIASSDQTVNDSAHNGIKVGTSPDSYNGWVNWSGSPYETGDISGYGGNTIYMFAHAHNGNWYSSLLLDDIQLVAY